MSALVQRRFSAGELAPAFYADSDLVKFATGARVVRNFQLRRTGGMHNRPGTEFIGEFPFFTTKSRIIKFVFNSSQTYVLVFQDKTMFVVKDGVVLTTAPQDNITAITQANPAVVTSASHGYSNGQFLQLSAIKGMTQLNNRTVKIAGVTTNTYSLQDMNGNAIDSTLFTAYTSGGISSLVYQIATPFAIADLANMRFIQSADVITITHQNYLPQKLERTGDVAWTLTPYAFAPIVPTPTGMVNDHSGGYPGDGFGWVVTAVDMITGEESLPAAETTETLTPAPILGSVITMSWSAVTSPNPIAYNVYKKTTAAGAYGYIARTAIGGTSFSDDGYIPDYTQSPPVARNPFQNIGTISAITAANPGVVTYADSTTEFNSGDIVDLSDIVGMIQLNGVAAMVLNPTSTTFDLFELDGFTPLDTSGFTSYISGGAAASRANYPACASYYQERLGFGDLKSDPEGSYFSKTGTYQNFTVSNPVQDDDAITFDSVGREVNEVRHLIDLGILVLLTSGGEHLCLGDVNGDLLPSSINRRQYGYNGSAELPPIVIGQSIIYLQAQGSLIFELGFDRVFGGVNGFNNAELSLYSQHLLDGYTITDWDYQKTPDSIVWMVRNDGTLLGLTYVPAQQLLGWHHHDFAGYNPAGSLDGVVQNVCVVPENGSYSVYLLISRVTDGQSRLYLERMYQRRAFDNIPMLLPFGTQNAYFLDASLIYDGRSQYPTVYMKVSGGTTWEYTETLTMTASEGAFVVSQVGQQIQIVNPADNSIFRFTITAYTSSTVISVQANRTVPFNMQSGGSPPQSNKLYQWAFAVQTVSGLSHLEGKTVGVLADGMVIASPNNPAYSTQYTVAGGSITLDQPYAVICVGLPIVHDLETLDMDTPQGETLANKQKLINELTVWLENSRGGFYGESLPGSSAASLVDGMQELWADNEQDDSYDSPPPLITDTRKIEIESGWTHKGRVAIRHVDPIPLTINAIAPSGAIPLNSGG